LEKMLKLKRHKGADYYLATRLVVRNSTAVARLCNLRIAQRNTKLDDATSISK
jgi:hypothetical protein